MVCSEVADGNQNLFASMFGLPTTIRLHIDKLLALLRLRVVVVTRSGCCTLLRLWFMRWKLGHTITTGKDDACQRYEANRYGYNASAHLYLLIGVI